MFNTKFSHLRLFAFTSVFNLPVIDQLLYKYILHFTNYWISNVLWNHNTAVHLVTGL